MASAVDLPLHLVYNPVGAFLPGPQAELEADYKRELKAHFGIVFNKLYTHYQSADRAVCLLSAAQQQA